MIYFVVFSLCIILIFGIVFLVGFKFIQLIFKEKEKSMNWIVRAEVNEAKSIIYREVADAMGGLHERVLTTWIAQGGVHSIFQQSAPLPYSNGNKLEITPNSGDGLTDGRTEMLNLLNSKPIQWVIPERLKELGKLTTNDNSITLHENTINGIVKHSVRIPTKQDGLIFFGLGFFVGACQSPDCIDRFFTTENHAKYCSDKCRKDTHRLKSK